MMSEQNTEQTDINADIRADGSDNRPPVYLDGPRVIYRASAVGGSSHVLAAARAGIDPAPFPAKSLQYMAEGVLHEPAIMERLTHDGWLLENIGADQAELEVKILGNIWVRLHPDGIATANFTDSTREIERGMRVVVEAKAMSDNVFSTFDRNGFDDFYRYAVQLSLQMEATGLPGLFAIKNRNDGTVKWQVFRTPPVAMKDIRKRLVAIDKGARAGNLNPLDEKCSSYPCQYHFLHDEDPAEFVVDDVVDNLAEMVERARERRKLAEDIERQARDRLVAHLGTAGKRETGTFAVNLIETKRPSRDWKRMEADGIDLEPYTTFSVSQQLRVKRLGVEE